MKKVLLFEHEIPHYRKPRSTDWPEQKPTR
jgi:hypothetical protein